MTDEQRTTVQALVDRWQIRLGLHTWRIELVDEPPDVWTPDDDSVRAAVWRGRFYEDARLWVSDEALDASDQELEASIVHELLHLRFRDVEGVVDMLDGLLHRDVLDTVVNAFRKWFEDAVDATAWGLTLAWPLKSVQGAQWHIIELADSVQTFPSWEDGHVLAADGSCPCGPRIERVADASRPLVAHRDQLQRDRPADD